MMGKVRYLFNNITLLNIVLIAVLAFAANYTLLPMLNINAGLTFPSLKKPAGLGQSAATTPVEHPRLSPSDFNIIAEQNLFHPERIIPPDKKAEPPPLPKPDVVLYGTLITDDARFAYLEDLKAPRNTAGRGKRQLILKIGDTLSGFVLKEIEADKIVMVRGEEQMTVEVHNTQRNKTKGTANAAQPSQKEIGKSIADTIHKPLPKTRAPRLSSGDEKAMQFFNNR
jgi:hypothetical protein